MFFSKNNTQGHYPTTEEIQKNLDLISKEIDEPEIESSLSILQATARDAIISKASCFANGYFNDPRLYKFASLARSLTATQPPSPSLRRGYFMRMMIIEQTIKAFVASYPDQPIQIVNIGSGLDPVAFRWIKKADIHWLDIDLPDVIVDKIKLMREDLELMHSLGSSSVDGFNFYSTQYKLIDCDIRIPSLFQKTLSMLDRNTPTLVIAECVLCYIDTASGNLALSVMRDYFEQMHLAVFEMVGANDMFGSSMIEDLEKLDVFLPGFKKYKTTSQQVDRFKHFFNRVFMSLSSDMYKNWVNFVDQKKMDDNDPISEEDLSRYMEIARHYSITIASNKKDSHHDDLVNALTVRYKL